MHAELRQAYDKEMHAAAEHYSGRNLDKAFYHLESEHILGQSFTFAHARGIALVRHPRRWCESV